MRQHWPLQFAAEVEAGIAAAAEVAGEGDALHWDHLLAAVSFHALYSPSSATMWL